MNPRSHSKPFEPGDERHLGRVCSTFCPSDDGVQDRGGAVGDRQFVGAGCEATPLLEVAGAALDDVAPAVVVSVKIDGSATSGAAPLPVTLLVQGTLESPACPGVTRIASGNPVPSKPH